MRLGSLSRLAITPCLLRKHIRIQSGRILTGDIHTYLQLADIFSRAVGEDHFQFSSGKMAIVSIVILEVEAAENRAT